MNASAAKDLPCEWYLKILSKLLEPFGAFGDRNLNNLSCLEPVLVSHVLDKCYAFFWNAFWAAISGRQVVLLFYRFNKVCCCCCRSCCFCCFLSSTIRNVGKKWRKETNIVYYWSIIIWWFADVFWSAERDYSGCKMAFIYITWSNNRWYCVRVCVILLTSKDTF